MSVMDYFFDKFSQRKNAQDMIRANQMAEEKEREKLEEKLNGYEETLEEIRRANLQTIENGEKTRTLLERAEGKFLGMESEKEAESARAMTAAFQDETLKIMGKQKDSMLQLEEKQERILQAIAAEEQTLVKQIEALVAAKEEDATKEEAIVQKLQEILGQTDTSIKQALADQFKNSEDFSHREAVKVYRNIQAVVEEENKKISEMVIASVESALAKKKSVAPLLFSVLAFLTAAAGVALYVCHELLHLF